jgi:hypothetical protein
MTTYSIVLVIHVISAIVWVGTTTTLTLLASYGTHRRDRELIERLPGLARWFGPRVIGPSSIGTLASGVFLVVKAHLGVDDLWIVIALAAFIAAAVVSVGVRLPATLSRRRAVAAGSAEAVERADRLLLEGSMAELGVLYLAVADMVLKPTTGGAWWFTGGAAILVLVALRVASFIRPNALRLEGSTR